MPLNGIDATRDSYNEAGQLLSTQKFRNEKPHGIWIYYFENSKTPRLKEPYLDGKLNGVRYTYAASGKVQKEETIKFNLLAGPTRTYYETGSLESVTEFKSGRKQGLYTAYYPSGTIKEQGEYAAGKATQGVETV